MTFSFIKEIKTGTYTYYSKTYYYKEKNIANKNKVLGNLWSWNIKCLTCENS